MIADCSNATSLARSGDPLNTSADHIYQFVCGTRRTSCSSLKFPMEVSVNFLAQHFYDHSDFSEQENDPDVLVQGKRHQVKAVPHVSVCRTANAHWPVAVYLNNAAHCRRKGYSENSSAVCCLQGVALLPSLFPSLEK